MVDLTTKLGPLTLKNPVLTASGTFGYGEEYHQFYDISKLGAITVKGIRMTPSNGNPTPRICEVTGGMMNAIGLHGPGVEKFLHGEHYMPFLRKTGATVIVNIWGTSIQEYGEVAARLESEKEGIAALEINISCPNVKAGGAAFGTDVALASEVIRTVRKATALPVITKLSPNVGCRIAEFARAAEAEGSDAVSLINTFTAMALDIETRRPKIANVTGGLSGPAVKPVAVKMVYDTAKAVKIPVIGMGGISDGADAVEFMLAGASAVAFGTANFVDPYAPLNAVRFIGEYMERHEMKQISDLVGACLI